VDFVYDAKEKSKDVAGSMRDLVESATNKTKEYAYDTKESAKDVA